MTALFRYLLHGKRGMLAAVTVSAAAMLLFGLTVFAYGYSERLYAIHLYELQKIGAVVPAYRFVPGGLMEIVSLAALTIWFVFVCANAFRTGTANGVSRRSVIRATVASVFVTSAAATAVNQGIRLGLVYGTSYFINESVYTMLFSLPPYEWNTSGAPASERSVQLSPVLNVRAVLCYFIAAVLLLTAVCFVYALYRKFGTLGLIGGAISVAMIWFTAVTIRSPYGDFTSTLKSKFFYPEPVITDLFAFGRSTIILIQPRGIPVIAAAVVTALVLTAVYAVCMKKASIKKPND
ncbi:MAG: hypothetical protein IKQ91_02705 [Oscillospiraceae bacterium]|nr:hypothetical protein [Oscillospiraceae bacterium]